MRTVFIDRVTPVTAEWLNSVDKALFSSDARTYTMQGAVNQYTMVAQFSRTAVANTGGFFHASFDVVALSASGVQAFEAVSVFQHRGASLDFSAFRLTKQGTPDMNVPAAATTMLQFQNPAPNNEIIQWGFSNPTETGIVLKILNFKCTNPEIITWK